MKKINGNCKAVRCLTNGKYYHSVKEAAEDNGVKCSSMSYAISKGTRCNGKEFSFESKTEANIMKMASNLSEMEMLRVKANAYDMLMARQEEDRKAKEVRDKKIADLTAKVEHHRELVKKANDRWVNETNKLMLLERELEDLTGEEVV
jgi:hypothetical protein